MRGMDNRDNYKNPNAVPNTADAPRPGPAPPVVKQEPVKPRPAFDRGDGVTPTRRDG